MSHGTVPNQIPQNAQNAQNGTASNFYYNNATNSLVSATQPTSRNVAKASKTTPLSHMDSYENIVV